MSRLERCAAWPVSWFMKTLGLGETFVPGFSSESPILAKKLAQFALGMH